jgi:putative SOS response-associated peptidase YedK
MCGRYASARKRIELLEEFRVERDRVTEPLDPDYNVAPTKPVYAVLTRAPRVPGAPMEPGTPRASGTPTEPGAPRDAEPGNGRGGARPGGALPGGATRELRVVRWGLVPSWAKDPAIGGRLINARAETVDSRPAFRKPFAKRRCLIPADGYYEWQPAETGPRTVKQPYYISRRDGAPLAMAGIYELWRDRALPDDHERAWLWTAAIITTSAPDELGRIHDRMPMIIEKDRWADWLDPASDDPADLRALLAPAAAGGLAWHPVSTAVNSVRHNGPELIETIEPGDAAAGPAGRAGSAGRAGGR